jgi:hypothetical protein
MDKKILLLSGYMQSGKDTVAEYLVSSFKFKRFAFADILKDETSDIYSISRELMDTTLGKATMLTDGKTVREVLIQHGAKRRQQDPDYWINLVVEKIKCCNNEYIVISDWRFKNEYNGIVDKCKHVTTLRINRWKEPPLLDESETSLDTFHFDYTIKNNGDIYDLYNHIFDFLSTL